MSGKLRRAQRNDQGRTVLEVVSEAAMAQAATQSMLTLTDAPTMMVDDVEESDNTPMGHVSTKMTVGVGEDGVPIGTPNRIDDHAKSTTEDPLG